MIPQDTFMVAAPIRPGAKQELCKLLASMNLQAGVADPANVLVPFGNFATLHFARFVILDDQTLSDLAAYNESFDDAPVYLVFLGDCDGPAGPLLATIAREAGSGLQKIFAHCKGFEPNIGLLAWMRQHSLRPAANYVNYVGRTVHQIREEAVLHSALIGYIASASVGEAPTQLHARLRQAVRQHGPILTTAQPAPVWFWLRQTLGELASGLLLLAGALLLLLTPLILLIPIYLYLLRRHELSDPVVPKPPHDIPSNQYVASLASIEDYDLVNQFSAFGHIKPGRFRGWTLIAVFWLLDFGVRHLYTRGRLARVGTIHFARWVFLDDRRRLLFASNYDGSLDSYMDDFINKVAYGLNLVFSNGIGYPRSAWLVTGGAKHELPFKYFLRRHQVPTQVWYKAYPSLSAADLAANTMIREGLQRASISEDEARAWLVLI